MEAQTSAGIVVVRQTAVLHEFLVLRAYRNWDFPKGLIEAGEDPLQAAIRETFEETGLADLQFRWGEAFCETAPYVKNKIARYYLAEVAAAPAVADVGVTLAINPQLGRPEHHEFRWVTAQQAALLLPARLAHILRWAQALLATSP